MTKELGWGGQLRRNMVNWGQCVCIRTDTHLYICACACRLVWEAWWMLSAKIIPLSFLLLNSIHFPEIGPLWNMDICSDWSCLWLPAYKWGPPFLLGVLPKLCLSCLQLRPANPLSVLNVPSRLHSACNVLPDTLATSESCIQRAIQSRIWSILYESGEKMFGEQR